MEPKPPTASVVATSEPTETPTPFVVATSEPTETPTPSAVATSVPEPPVASTLAPSEPTETPTPSVVAPSEPTETPATSTSTVSVPEPTSASTPAASVRLAVASEAAKPTATSTSSVSESTETPPTSTVATSVPEPTTTPTSIISESMETPPTSTVATSKPTETPPTSTSTVSVPDPTSPAAVWGSPGERSLLGANGPGRGSQGSLEPGDLDSVSVLSGTLESLASSFPDDVSSMGSDSEVAAPSYRRTDRYGFLGGSQYSEAPESSVPVDVARQRELKWLEMFNHWDKWLTRRYQKVKLRCRKGIPSSLRARAWQLLSDSKSRLEQNPGLFQELERQAGEPRWLDAIEKDLHRQFPFHEMFAARGGHGQQDLYRILKAYTVLRPHEGYCQAQAPVAAVLLMQMPAEQAFWCLVQICDKYLPGYYSAGLEALQLDGEVFGALLRRAAPAAHRHLRRLRVEPLLYLTEWFMCLFARSLPWAAVLRVWDMFFCEGVKVLFRVGLVLLRQALGSADKLRSCPGLYETLERLRSVPPPGLHEDNLVLQVSSVPLSESLLERETWRQLRRRLEARGEPPRAPPPRLHGARAIHAQRLRGELQERTRGQAPVDTP
ncbi:TBC1 domain family member 10B-like isoform X2 [Phaenicophaeus curvirostris]|uniref:TBC1 domain family member 10B-like isoform X2 n=1 Tax=Phaenicophaeus curvirostris TaxID=33595 RepID=UPI0037F0E4ED